MTRIEQNAIMIDAIAQEEKRKPKGTYEEMVSFQLGAIASMLADISLSLAIIADNVESGDKE